jgi:hypothetical protein
MLLRPMQRCDRLGGMADGFNPYLTGSRRSPLQYLAARVEQFSRPPLTGSLPAPI